MTQQLFICISLKDFIKHNQKAWDSQAKANVPWSQPVSSEVVEKAKQGIWDLYVLPTSIEQDWIGDVKGKKVLCLASAGGQQGPILAALGAEVTVFDLSEEQLLKDREVATRDQLNLVVKQGDMRDLSVFENASFDLIVHPISNLYVDDVTKVWDECFRVLKIGGKLISSFYNPVVFVEDRQAAAKAQGLIYPKYKIPYADQTDLSQAELDQKIDKGEALVFGHSLRDLIGGQTRAGFAITAYEEAWQPNPRFTIDAFIPTFIATLSVKIK